MMKKKIKRFQEGGMSEDEAKAAGLEASKEDKVGFLERLRMGNIDDEGSEAYKRFGAGRGRAARIPVEDRVGTPVEEIRARNVSAAPTLKTTTAPATVSDDMMASGVAEGMRKGSGDASVAEMYSGPRTKPIEASARAATPSPVAVRSSSSAAPKKLNQANVKASGAPAPNTSKQKPDYRRTDGNSSGVNKTRSVPATTAISKPSAPAPRKSAMDMIPTDGYGDVSGGERIDSSELGRNVSNTLAAIGPKGLTRTTGAARDVVRRKEIFAKELADRKSELAGELRKGQAKTKFTSQSKAPSKRTKKLDDSDAGVEFKRGGSVSPASKRADGIAVRGKTRCKIC